MPERFSWLSKGPTVRSTVLAELGRLEDEEAIRSLAAHLCKEKPSTRRAVGELRRIRRFCMGVPARSPSSTEGLYQALVKAVEDYEEAHIQPIRGESRSGAPLGRHQ